jgi:predicted ATPase
VAEHFVDGVHFVPLEHARTATSAWQMIAATLGNGDADDARASVLRSLAARRPLLVLDNLEQLDGCADVISMLLDFSLVAILATSRGPVHVRDENSVVLGPLRLPTELMAAEEFDASPAIRLFTREARRVRPSFELTDSNRPSVAAICSKLQGLPLAIVLAAARVRMLSPSELNAALSEQLALGSADRDRPERQRTLRSTIAWSYDLLTDSHQDAFVRLAVFEGGCDLAAAAELVEDDRGELVAFDVIGRLADVALVAMDEQGDGGVRISLLTAVAEFARGLLATRPDTNVLRRRHAVHYTNLAEEAEVRLRGPHQLYWSDRLSIEHSNLGAAFEWAASPAGDASLAGRLAGALGWFWYTHGRASDGRVWLERAVELDAAAPTATATRAKTSHALGVLQQQQGDNDAASTSFERSLELWRELHDETGIAQELNSLGVTRLAQGRPHEARALLEESTTIARRAGRSERVASALSNLGMVALTLGAVDTAIASLEEALVIDQRAADSWAIAVDQGNLGLARIRNGDLAAGHELLRNALAAATARADPDLFASLIEGCAVAAVTGGDPERAAILIGAADSMRDAAGVPRTVVDHEYLETMLTPLRVALDPARDQLLRLHGAGLEEPELVRIASAPLS